MKCRYLYILMGVALAIVQVSGLRALQDSYDRPSDLESDIPLSKEIDPQAAYTSYRWVGLRTTGKAGGCPVVQGWDGESWLDRVLRASAPEPPTLEAAAPKTYSLLRISREDLDLLRHLGADRFCVYAPKTDPPQKFVAPSGLVAQRDRMVLAARADELKETVGPVLAEHFRTQAGGAPVALAGPPNVRLTFIDSQPDGDGLPSRAPWRGSQHGYTLAHLARELLCPEGGACAVQIASRRALHYDNFHPDRELRPLPAAEGGHLGLIQDLADAILLEVLQWRQTGSPRHLILNLSLGWDGELLHKIKHDLDTRKVAELEPAVQEVYKALLFARKRGVLVIAAAGNRRGGPKPSDWPLLPAAWELRRPSYLPFALGRKPVYAVGGVDWQGLPLSNSRSGGHPRRVAYGDHAVANVRSEAGGEALTPIYTGSSVSTAVVSSAAAAVWHLRPELRRSQLLRLIRLSGNELETRADFYAWRKIWPLSVLLPAPKIRRISVCAAVKGACDGGRCSAPAVPDYPDWERESAPLASRFPPIGGPSPTPRPTEPLQPSFTPPCESGLLRSTPGKGMPDPPCLTSRFVSVTTGPWTLPQPGDNPCSGCALVQPPERLVAVGGASDSAAAPEPELYQLKLQIHERWQSPSLRLERAVLEIDCSSDGRSKTLYELSFDQMSPDLQTIEDLGDGRTLRGCRARLDFALRTPGGEWISVQSPVVIDP